MRSVIWNKWIPAETIKENLLRNCLSVDLLISVTITWHFQLKNTCRWLIHVLLRPRVSHFLSQAIVSLLATALCWKLSSTTIWRPTKSENHYVSHPKTVFLDRFFVNDVLNIFFIMFCIPILFRCQKCTTCSTKCRLHCGYPGYIMR